MADKKITELSVSQTVAADDSVFADVNGSARKVAISLILALLEDVYATLESPAFTGSPTAPTPADTDNSTRVATTAFLKSVLKDYAKLASPTFTGTPKTSTPISTDDSTRIPTTAWVKDRIAEANTGGESGGGGGSGGLSVSYDNESGNIVFSEGGSSGSGGGTSEKPWELKRTITIEEETAYISEQLGNQYSSVLLIFENVWSGSGGKSTSISFNGFTPSGVGNSVSGREYINTSTFPSSGFYEAEMLENGYAKITTGGVNSGGNRGAFSTSVIEVSVLPPSYLKSKNFFDEVAFSLAGYATHKLNAGAIIRIYAR